MKILVTKLLIMTEEINNQSMDITLTYSILIKSPDNQSTDVTVSYMNEEPNNEYWYNCDTHERKTLYK